MTTTLADAIPAPTHAVGDHVAGFVIEQIETVTALRSVAYVLRHPASGARLLKLHNADAENLFAIGLRTPPSDDTGIAHILEHTVLCGSQRFPVKDPFVELLKTSLASFLNAMTYPDRTVYPCASQNRRDFFNLVDVYCDAVYRPLLREFHFQQEGHRLGFSETGNPESDLVIKGIVYNEMKGAYSDFSGSVYRQTKGRLFPDNSYGCDSGGDPQSIPNLTYDNFCEFHRTLYHPSNSLLFAYGDVSLADLADHLEQHLSGFTACTVDTTIAEQPRWTTPRVDSASFPIGAAEDPADHYAVSLTWMCGSSTDTDAWLTAQLLAGYLLDHDAAPLRRALIASGLGKGLMGSGYMDSVRDTAFTVGLRGTAPDAGPAIEQLVLDCLRQEATGLDRDLLRAALHQMEIDLGDVPSMYPLHLMARAYRRWVYDCDPIEALDLGPGLARLAELIEQPDGPERALQTMLIDNPHRLLMTWRPDAELQAREAEAERADLAKRQAELSAAELQAIADRDAAVEAAQREGNTPEALATLPRLSRSDVPDQSSDPEVSETAYGSARHLSTNVLHGAVSHWELAFDLSGLDNELIEWLPLFNSALTRLGAGGISWDQLSTQQEAVLGGISASTSCMTRVDDQVGQVFQLTMGSCALHRNVDAMAEYMLLRANALDLTDHDRLRELIAERAVHLRNGVISGGSGYASRYAARGLTASAAISERLGGFSQIRWFEQFAKQVDDQLDEAVSALGRIRDYIAGQAPAVLSTVGANDAKAVAKLLNPFAGHAGSQAGAAQSGQGAKSPSPTGEPSGIAAASDVSFVALVAQLGEPGDIDLATSAALHLLSNQLRVGFLWERIRVLGGAYGARSGWNRHSQVFSLASYRDPHIERTLATYQEIAGHVATDMDLSTDALGQAIIGSMKSFDRPLRPDDAVGQTLWRYLRGSLPDRRQAFRQAVLGLTADHVRSAATDYLGPALAQGSVCVLSSRSKLEQAQADGLALEISDL